MQLNLCSFSYKGLPFCKRCGSSLVRMDGRYKRAGKHAHKYRCKRCGFGFVWTSDLPQMRHGSGVIAFAGELYSRAGISLRTTAQILGDHFNVKVSYEAVRQWVLKCGELPLPSIEPEYSPVWHADETYIKINGEGHWLWLVYCHETAAALAWHLSKDRTEQDAITVLRKAKQAAGMRPSELMTDGLWEYQYAAKKVFGYRFVKHTVDSGIGKNAPIERLNEEVKRRVKWFRAFRAVECAGVFIGLWVYHWNHKHKNRRLGCTPARAAGSVTVSLQSLLKGYAALQTSQT